MSLNIGVLGVGGVGGYFGGKLCRLISSRGIEVHFVARGDHLECIRRDGLLVRTETEGEWTSWPTSVTDRVEELPPLDVCLVCVKSYDLTAAIQKLRQKVSDATFIVPLLNGIDIYERIRAVLDVGQVLQACAYIGTHIESPGKIHQQGGACKILLGSSPQVRQVNPERLFDLFDQSGISYAWQSDVLSTLWQKFIFIAAYGLVGAGFDKTLGQILESPDLSKRVQLVMSELTQLAQKQGISLPDNIVSESFEKGHDFPFGAKTSFHRDFERAGKPDERDLFGGAAIRLGQRLDVPTPAIGDLYALLERRKNWPT